MTIETAEGPVTLDYLRQRYPDAALRAAMATDADDIAVRARDRGNLTTAATWRDLAKRFRESLRPAVTS